MEFFLLVWWYLPVAVVTEDASSVGGRIYRVFHKRCDQSRGSEVPTLKKGPRMPICSRFISSRDSRSMVPTLSVLLFLLTACRQDRQAYKRMLVSARKHTIYTQVGRQAGRHVDAVIRKMIIA